MAHSRNDRLYYSHLKDDVIERKEILSDLHKFPTQSAEQLVIEVRFSDNITDIRFNSYNCPYNMKPHSLNNQEIFEIM